MEHIKEKVSMESNCKRRLPDVAGIDLDETHYINQSDEECASSDLTAKPQYSKNTSGEDKNASIACKKSRVGEKNRSNELHLRHGKPFAEGKKTLQLPPSNNFECLICKSKFQDRRRMYLHYSRFHTMEHVTCQLCSSNSPTLKSAKTLEGHLGRFHKGCTFNKYLEQFYAITPADLVFEAIYEATCYSSRGNVDENELKETATQVMNGCYLRGYLPTNEKKPYACSSCEHSFFIKESLDMHILRFHVIVNKECKICDVSVPNGGILIDHLRAEHEVELDTYLDQYQCGTPKDVETQKSSWKPVNENNLQCYICKLQKPNKNSLSHHYCEQHTLEKHNCRLCGKQVLNFLCFKKHLHACHTDYTVGTYLEKFFKTTISVLIFEAIYEAVCFLSDNHSSPQHLKSATTIYSQSRQVLQKEQLSVRDNSPFPCVFCNRTFDSMESVHLHVFRLHCMKKEKCLMCDDKMEERQKNGGSLEMHLRKSHQIHIDQYLEIYCNTSVTIIAKSTIDSKLGKPSSQNNYTEEVKAQGKHVNYARCRTKSGIDCQVCQKKFENETILKKHFLAHIRINHTCQFCPRKHVTIHTLGLLHNHLKEMHGTYILEEYTQKFMKTSVEDLVTNAETFLKNMDKNKRGHKYPRGCPIVKSLEPQRFCMKCRKFCKTSKIFLEHIKRDHQLTYAEYVEKYDKRAIGYKCKICLKRILSKKNLETHLLYKHRMLGHACLICKTNVPFANAKSFEGHLFRIHKDISLKSYLKEYMNTTLADLKIENNKFLCSKCDWFFPSVRYRSLHMFRQHGARQNLQSHNSPRRENAKKLHNNPCLSKHTKNFKTPKVSNQNVENESFRNKQKERESKIYYVCRFCKTRFTSIYSLKFHQEHNHKTGNAAAAISRKKKEQPTEYILVPDFVLLPRVKHKVCDIEDDVKNDSDYVPEERDDDSSDNDTAQRILTRSQLRRQVECQKDAMRI